MITLKLKIKEVEFELTHVEALKLYNELSLFFNWQPTSISPRYPIVSYDDNINIASSHLSKGESASGTEEHKIWAT